MLVLFLFLNVLFDLFAPRSLGISRIENLDNNIGRVDYFVELVPNTFALTGFE